MQQQRSHACDEPSVGAAVGERITTLHAKEAVTAATFVIPRPGLSVLIDGQPTKTVRHSKTETTFYVDLAAGQSVKVELRDTQNRPVNFAKTNWRTDADRQSKRAASVVR